jgi:simple sugar transport system ATP-binding protein
VADRCTVLRKGRCVGTVNVSDTTPEQMSMMMVGRPVDLVIEKGPAHAAEPALTVERLSVIDRAHGKRLVNDVSFTVRRGEIVCVAGIDGNGQGELAYALTGLMRSDSGKVTLNGTDITGASIRRRNDMGVSHIPEDRHKHGLVLDYSLAENMILKSYHKPEFQRRGFLRFGRMRGYTNQLIGQFDIRAGQGGATPARSMSGGNQQKAIVARELSISPDLLIAVQPTRGLDVGAIEYIHRQLIDARDQNKAVLMISLELDEVMNLPDRILVMFEGELVADVSPDDITVEELGLYMAGSKREAAV